MLPRNLLESPAWRALGINARRLIDVLMIEHLRHGGKANGALKAPRRQLEQAGIGARYVSAAIQEAEALGLVIAHRRGCRVATLYELAWLPRGDGRPSCNKYLEHMNGNIPDINVTLVTSQGKSGLVYKGKSDGQNLTDKGKSDGPKSLVYKGKHLSRKESYRVERRKPTGQGGHAR